MAAYHPASATAVKSPQHWGRGTGYPPQRVARVGGPLSAATPYPEKEKEKVKSRKTNLLSAKLISADL